MTTGKGIFVDPNDVYASYDKAFAVDPKMKKFTDKIRKSRAFEPPPAIGDDSQRPLAKKSTLRDFYDGGRRPSEEKSFPIYDDGRMPIRPSEKMGGPIYDDYEIVEFELDEDDFIPTSTSKGKAPSLTTTDSSDTYSNIYSDPYNIYSNPYTSEIHPIKSTENFAQNPTDNAQSKKTKSIILWILLILVIVGIIYYIYKMSKGGSCKSSVSGGQTSPSFGLAPEPYEQMFGHFTNMRPVNAFRQPKH
jgi:hypothetical protein